MIKRISFGNNTPCGIGQYPVQNHFLIPLHKDDISWPPAFSGGHSDNIAPA
jgi:hypothetical protein